MNKRDVSEKMYVALTLKITCAILIGLVLAICMYVLCAWFEHYITETKYTGKEAVEKNINAAYDDLETYISKNKVKGADSESLMAWLEEQDSTYLFVYDNFTNYFDSGVWESEEARELNDELTAQDDALDEQRPVMEEERIDEDTFPTDLKNRILEFSDGKYYVFIDQFKEQAWQDVMHLMTIVLCFLTLFTTMLVYNGRMTKRIVFFSSEVKRVSDGELDYMIRARHNDEIGDLAVAVDNMRMSIIEKHQKERAAWEANNQLITAMSHDIRTPLTSMIGYLDIIEGKKYETEEQLDRYVSSCRDKAFQLKELSDQLFRYFLVFGNEEKEKKLECFDASILFQQLLSEHGAEIVSYGYKVNFLFGIPEINVMADVSGLRRLFDNIFSNIMKYASMEDTIEISAEADEETIKIRIVNSIRDNVGKVESTRIGLRTCEKICSDMNGRFLYVEQDGTFAATVILPVTHREEPGENEAYTEKIT